MPNIGKLDRFIKILSISKSRDESGQVVLTTSLFHEAFAAINPVIGRERFAAEREMAIRSYKFLIRYKDGLTEEMIVEFEGEEYDIVGLAPMGNRNRHWLEIACQYRRETPLVG